MNKLDLIAVFMASSKPVSYISQSPRLLDQLREVLEYKYYNLHADEADLYWVKLFVRWHGRSCRGCHPRGFGGVDISIYNK